MKKFLFIITALFGLVFAQGVVTQLDNGSINYSDQSITAVGIGFVPTNAVNAGQARRMALRIAKQDAMRQLIEIVNGVTLTSETTMSGAMVDDVINTKVRGFIRGARPVGQPKYLSDTSVEMEYSVPMSGIYLQLPYPRPISLDQITQVLHLVAMLPRQVESPE